MKNIVIFTSVILISLICSWKTAEVQAAPVSFAVPIGYDVKPTVVPSVSPTSTHGPKAKEDNSGQVPIRQALTITPAPSIQPSVTPVQVPVNNDRTVQPPVDTQTNPPPPQGNAVTQKTVTANTNISNNNVISDPVPVVNYQDSNDINVTTPGKTVQQKPGKPPVTFYIPSNSENYYFSEGLSSRNTVLLLLTGLVFIGIGNFMVKEKRQDVYSHKISERIFYDWA